MDEFGLIERFFNRGNDSDDVAVGIGDDGAVLKHESGLETVVVTDTLVDGVHFPSGTAPADLGYKSMAVNLSDMAAMGASPRWALLNLVLPEANENWLENFSIGLFSIAKQFAVSVVGGDTVRGPLCITVTVGGALPEGSALKRSGARSEDQIWVTGTLGDAAIGLELINKTLASDGDGVRYLMNRLNRPNPRVLLGTSIRSLASAAVDISDGLMADLGHILDQSGKLGAVLDMSKLPLSREAVVVCGESSARKSALSGGDDYELCFTARPEHQEQIEQLAGPCDVRITQIGVACEKSGLQLTGPDSDRFKRAKQGYKHVWQ